MVVIPGGTFKMGSPSNEIGRGSGGVHEGPQRDVTIAAFAAGMLEVTFAEWALCVDGGGCKQKTTPSDEGWGRDARPVINITWNDAKAYAEWLAGKTGKSYRLLTEAEWEYAARADTTTAFHTGPTITSYKANINGRIAFGTGLASSGDPNLQKTVEVGSYEPNAFGLYDMHGNVNEYVEDCTGTYQDAPTDGRARRGPLALSAQCHHIVRGGSWVTGPEAARSATRNAMASDASNNTVGFRVARSLAASSVPQQ